MSAKPYFSFAVAASFAFGLAKAALPLSQQCFQNALQPCILAGKDITATGSGINASGPYGPVGTVYVIDLKHGGSGDLTGCGGSAKWKFDYSGPKGKFVETVYDGSAQAKTGKLTAFIGDGESVTKDKTKSEEQGADMVVYCSA